MPDCQGKSLEEVDRLFHEGVPVRKLGGLGRGWGVSCRLLRGMRKQGRDTSEKCICIELGWPGSCQLVGSNVYDSINNIYARVVYTYSYQDF